MKTLTKILSTLAVVLGLAAPAWAQSYTISHTTLSAAVTATATTLTLTSASASSGSSFGAPAAGQCLMVEGELMRITATSSTTMTVQRATGTTAGNPVGTSTTATSHPNTAVVWTAPCNAFKNAEPPVLTMGAGTSGACNLQPAPWINTKTANVWWCNTVNNNWSGTNYANFAYGSVPLAQ